jgi:hypothetical protein
LPSIIAVITMSTAIFHVSSPKTVEQACMVSACCQRLMFLSNLCDEDLLDTTAQLAGGRTH